MAWKGRSKPKVDYKSLRTDLISSDLQKENEDLYSVINSLLDGASDFETRLNDKLGKTDKIDGPTQVDGLIPVTSGGVVAGRYDPNPLVLVSNL